jgi:ADP-ribose pyrophosphatase YjhB (NUDIX family)
MTIRVSGILIHDKKLLLISHRKRGEIYWLLPGGGVQYGEPLETALKREFMEELNIRIDVQQPALICDSIEPKGKRHILNICFHCIYNSGQYRLGKERRLNDYGFFSVKEIKEKTIYPPIKKSLVSILKNQQTDMYLGRVWQD